MSTTATVGPVYPFNLQASLTYASDGVTLTDAKILQFYRNDVTAGGVVICQPAPASPIPASLTVDLVAHAADTITSPINGTPTSITVADLLTALTAYLAQQRAAQIAP